MTHCARVRVLIALTAVASAAAGAQVATDPRIFGDGDYRDVLNSRPAPGLQPTEGHIRATDIEPLPWRMSPRGLRLTFDDATDRVVVAWRQPLRLLHGYQSSYQMRVKTGREDWGPWNEVGPIEAAGSAVIDVHRGEAYRVQVRTASAFGASRPATRKVRIPKPRS